MSDLRILGDSPETAPRKVGRTAASRSSRLSSGKRRDAPAPEWLSAAALFGDEFRRLIYNLYGVLIGFFGGLAPVDQAVLGEQDEPGIGVGPDRLANLFGEGKARADVGDPDSFISEALSCQLLTVLPRRRSC